MDIATTIAYAIFVSYFLLIFGSFALVCVSIGAQRPAESLLETRPFAFLRAAIGGLVCTWYFMFEFMKWSYLSFRETHYESTVGDWLVNTSLFEQAWRAVCVGQANWWWSSWICTAAVFFAAGIWFESARRGIRYPWAYMVLGQLVAISVAIALFLTAVYMHDKRPIKPKAPFLFWALLLAALVTEGVMPKYAGTSTFMPALGTIHLAVLVPLVFVPTDAKVEKRSFASVGFKKLTLVLAVIAAVVHWGNTVRLLRSLPASANIWSTLGNVIVSHPAQGSVSLDVVWVAITALMLAVLTGSTTAMAIKAALLAAVIGVVAVRQLGVNWLLIASCFPILILLGIAGLAWQLSRVRTRNVTRRAALLGRLGIKEGVVPGTATSAPTVACRRLVVGFWHPYCNAGGGGERVLWTAIAWLQKEDPDVVVLVYSGDYPAASKAEILGKVTDRFAIELSPATLEFIPLPSRHLISDTHWRRFTLLGQSFGSVCLAWEGLCGKDGVWPDIFIDSMGYGFVLPFVRLLTGSEVAIGAYTHYPTVSADMVKRVRERSAGVENGGVAGSMWRTQAKLVYYHIFTAAYSLALLFSEHTMTNSSWTQAHIQSLLTSARTSFSASLLLMDESTQLIRESRGEASADDRPRCEVVYPPCDTRELAKLGNLANRKRELVSLAQFRPEKDHAKQLHSLAILLNAHPEYKSGAGRVHLTLMGGSRGEADEARLAALRALAKELSIEDHVTFLVNAPYPEIVRRLGDASLGLNTMQDEHFGINVVEFMAAGLIPIVHASAGPLLDIVVPYEGQKTGFHATDAESFAAAIHDALSLPPDQAFKMRTAARALAETKFSEAAFGEGFESGWVRLVHRAEERLGEAAAARGEEMTEK